MMTRRNIQYLHNVMYNRIKSSQHPTVQQSSDKCTISIASKYFVSSVVQTLIMHVYILKI